MSRRSRMSWALANAAGLALVLVCNGLANALPLNGMSTGQLSDLTPNLFVPVGLTFSIWGLIYLWLLASVAYGFALVGQDRPRNPLGLLGPWFLVSCLANAAWIFAWHWMLVELSLGIMLLILGSLVTMYLRLGVGRQPAPATDRWLVHAPVSVYLGWITVATVANVTTLAVDLGAPAFGGLAAGLTMVVLGAVVLIGLRVLHTRRDVAFGLVIVWAFLGIYLKRSVVPELDSQVVAGAAMFAMLAMALAVGVTAVGNRRRHREERP